MKKVKLGFAICISALIFTTLYKTNFSYDVDTNQMPEVFLEQGLKSIKIKEQNIKRKEDNINISGKMPIVYYKDKNIQQNINLLIDREVNEFINTEIQNSKIFNEQYKKNVEINYYIPFEDKNILNIVIDKKIFLNKDNYYFIKDSYIFDLNSGQIISIGELLKDNPDYKNTIRDYLVNYINKNNLPYSINKIIVNSETGYYLLDDGIGIYLNPYKDSYEKLDYEFKIPYSIFKNKITKVKTNRISASIDYLNIIKEEPYINSILNIPVININNKDIEKNINKILKSDILGFYEKVKKEASQYYSDAKGVGINPFVANVTFDVKENENNILSIYTIYYQYSGGAHGYNNDITYNIDLSDGKLIELKDLFKENIDYKVIINEKINKQIDEIINEYGESTPIYEFKGIKDNQQFYLQDNNLVVYFELYEIAPYAAGIPKFEIPLKELKDVLNEKYRESLLK
jgi:hypothetical protein